MIAKIIKSAVCPKLRLARLIGAGNEFFGEKEPKETVKPKLTKEEETKREEMIRARVFAGIDLPHVPKLEIISQPLQVHSLANGGFMVNQQWIPGSILIFPKRCFVWGVAQPREIKPHTLEIIKYIKPKPRISETINYNRLFDNRNGERIA